MDIVIIHIIGGQAHITTLATVTTGTIITIQMDTIMDTMMDLIGGMTTIILLETIQLQPTPSQEEVEVSTEQTTQIIVP